MSDPPRALGADRVERLDGETVVLRCPVSKTWQGRTARSTVRRDTPERRSPGPSGSTKSAPPSHWRTAACGIVSHPGKRARPSAGSSATTRTASAAARRGREDSAAAVRTRGLSILLAPLAGLLPGSVQKTMESEFGAPALGMTVASALPLFVVGFLGMFGHILGMAGGSLGWPAWLALPLPIAVYLFGEAPALRLASAIAGREPMGSFPVVVAHAAWKEARGEGGAP